LLVKEGPWQKMLDAQGPERAEQRDTGEKDLRDNAAEAAQGSEF
jgi:hypothetical protein